MIDTNTITHGDCLSVLRTWPDAFVQCIVTSPPYWGLRDYGVDGQLGLEKSPEEYTAKMVEVFRECRRVLKADGVLWLNLGDSYIGGGRGFEYWTGSEKQSTNAGSAVKASPIPLGLKPKDLCGIPWRIAFALQADGWYLRSDIIWAKKNCMPESVTDRPTRSHEFVFLMSKSARYYYNSDAIKEPSIYDIDGTGTAARKARQSPDAKSVPTAERHGIRPAGLKDARNFGGKNGDKQRGHSRRHAGFNDRWDAMDKEEQCTGYRNKRDVWSIATEQFPEAHFAVMPVDLVSPCVLAGSRPGDIVLDPFMGAGTVALVAKELNRQYLGIELNADYIRMAERRLRQEVLGLV